MELMGLNISLTKDLYPAIKLLNQECCTLWSDLHAQTQWLI